MQQLESVTGFSELKDMLIRTYEIERSRELIKLYFSEQDQMLLMHDYDDHNKAIHLCFSIKEKLLRKHLTHNARKLIEDSLEEPSPSNYLNTQFQLYGFFRF
jgi:hypothetical protein